MSTVAIDNTQREFILTNLDGEGVLSSLKLKRIAKLLDKKPKEMIDIIKSLGIKIINNDIKVFDNSFSRYIGEKGSECKDLWKEAKNKTYF